MTDPKMTELNVDNPMPLMQGHFGLMIPTDCSPEAFAAIREQLEFRRKCMNQGWDNLLELLAMHEKNIFAAKERVDGQDSAPAAD